MTSIELDFPLQDVVRAAIDRHELPGWTLHDESFWCHVTGPERTTRVQGWKLHLSATALSAPLVLHAAAEIFLAAECQFKFARDLAKVEELTSVRFDRAQAGKFIAAYPRDEAEFHRLAALLADATVGLPGPRILSDRPYRAGSIVQYRYGAFTGIKTLTNDGSFEARLQAPDGTAVTDHRNPWFAAPAWVTPLEAKPQPSPGKKPTLDNGRFEVVDAIRHTARGGIYRAVDTMSGSTVIVKQARAHIGSRRDGRDSRVLLEREAQVLTALAPLTPAVLAQFHDGDYAFLAEELVPGRSLADHIAANTGRTVDTTRTLALAVLRLVQAVHDRGWVVRDLSSGNVMITPDDRAVLIDPEFAARPEELVHRIYTPGFAAPEVLSGAAYGPAPAPTADLFAAGAILVNLMLGAAPAFLGDRGADRTLSDRIAGLLDTADSLEAIRRWRPVLLGLTAHDPAERWPLSKAIAFLEKDDPAASRSRAGSTDHLVDRILDDGLDHLVSTATPDAHWLWSSEGFGASTDPLNVQYGAAGVLSVLRRAASDRQHAGAAEMLRTGADWIGDRLERTPRILPGLYFGRAGSAWALAEAAQSLGDVGLAEKAEAFALALPVEWPNPDICHGAAGSGFTQLRFWQLSGRADFLDRVRRCADGLLASAVETTDGVFWPVLADFDSSMAGAWQFGFAHGVAGVGAFLLAAGQATGDQRYLDAAVAAGDTLATAAEPDSGSDGLVWRSERTRRDITKEMRFHWCSGASGVGTFLVRLAAAYPGRTDYRDLTLGAARAVHGARWTSPTASCHGLAGNAQFLLDAAELQPDDAAFYRDQATDLITVLTARHAVRNGQLLVPDESGLKVALGYSTGLAGVLDLLLRYRHGGARSWMTR